MIDNESFALEIFNEALHFGHFIIFKNLISFLYVPFITIFVYV